MSLLAVPHIILSKINLYVNLRRIFDGREDVVRYLELVDYAKKQVIPVPVHLT